jgi:hypothetical protein
MVNGEVLGFQGERQKRRRRGGLADAIIAATAVVIAGAALAVWEPWADGAPFTALNLTLQDGKYTNPGAAPNSCTRTAASEEETVLLSTDGERLAAGREAKEGTLLGPEYGDWAGYCAFSISIDNAPGGQGTYLWGSTDRFEVSEDDLRRPLKEQMERLKTTKRPQG